MTRDEPSTPEAPEPIEHWFNFPATYWESRCVKAEAEVDRLRGQVARVEEQHARYGSVTQNGWCRHCGQPWPCDTRAALAGTAEEREYTPPISHEPLSNAKPGPNHHPSRAIERRGYPMVEPRSFPQVRLPVAHPQLCPVCGLPACSEVTSKALDDTKVQVAYYVCADGHTFLTKWLAA